MRTLTSAESLKSDALNLFLAESLAGVGKPTEHVLVIIPDDTRAIPMPEIYAGICRELTPRVDRLTFLIALGTHPKMTDAELSQHLGSDWQRPDVSVVQHDWQNADMLVNLGTIPASELEELSGGLLSEALPVVINRLAAEVDRILIVNPVIPHEVVGFSGGHKYLFPGISGEKILDASHWLGALITNLEVNGHKSTPVRALIERAAELLPTPRHGLALVMRGHETIGAFFGGVREAWSAAADLSAQTNIVWKSRSFHTVISIAPSMYRDLWTAGKCMYKVEPVIADGGQVIIYAPHLHEIAPTHERWIRHVGYHTRDYFLIEWDRFANVPRAILAHSTHVKGTGSYIDGFEKPRIDVVLATDIPEARCQEINLGYLDHTTIDIDAYRCLEDEGILVIPNAGEVLFRLSDSD